MSESASKTMIPVAILAFAALAGGLWFLALSTIGRDDEVAPRAAEEADAPAEEWEDEAVEEPPRENREAAQAPARFVPASPAQPSHAPEGEGEVRAPLEGEAIPRAFVPLRQLPQGQSVERLRERLQRSPILERNRVQARPPEVAIPSTGTEK